NHCNRMTVMATQDASEADDCVSIHTVERALGDYAMQHKDVYYKAPESETGVNVAVVGAGPAGLTAAYYLRKAGHSVTVYEKMEKAGGMLQYAIPNYRLPKHYVDEVAAAIEGMGVKFEFGKELGRDFDAESLERRFDKVFYATGAWKRPVLGFDGEEFTEFGLEFLVEVNKWMNKKKRENVIVIGGGNVAMDVAVTAKRLGAKSVTLIFRKPENELTASREEIERAKEEGVQIMPQWGVKRALYKDGQVTGMELKRTFYTRDEKGKLVLHYDEDETTIVNADSVLMAAGQQVDLSFLGDYASARGRLVVDEESQATSHTGVYAGGDIVSGPSTVISAIRQGRNAAEAINASVGIAKPVYKHEGFLKFDPSFAELHRGVKDISIPVEERNLEREDTVTISMEAAEAEAKRCMNCGCYSVNASDISPALLLLDADIVTTKRTIKAAEFFTEHLDTKDQLEPGEIVTEIVVKPDAEAVTHYEKFRIRKSLDFAIVSLASSYKAGGKDIRLVLGGVAPVPVELTKVEEYLAGKELTDDVIAAAAELSVEGALPIRNNEYKVQEVRVMVKRFLESIR
ncbi:MAG TPA: FAD-dependent oxidoreductase, partial [Candidatus Scatomorpha pullistercoris]|nr:FAD-dependent oxidoreductase [Candidatus Scatomorpha pullistercoris]